MVEVNKSVDRSSLGKKKYGPASYKLKPEVVCPMQRGAKVSLAWCSQSQCYEVCGNCAAQVRPPREVSFFSLEGKEGLRGRGSRQSASRPAGAERVLPGAIGWLMAHRAELYRLGWTAGELFRRNAAHRGLAWWGIWRQPELTVEIDGGAVRFTFAGSGGRVVRQSAWPRKLINQWGKNAQNRP